MHVFCTLPILLILSACDSSFYAPVSVPVTVEGKSYRVLPTAAPGPQGQSFSVVRDPGSGFDLTQGAEAAAVAALYCPAIGLAFARIRGYRNNDGSWFFVNGCRSGETLL